LVANANRVPGLTLGIFVLVISRLKKIGTK